MKAIIGSINKAKITGALKALSLLGVDSYEAIRVDTSVEQPVGLVETIELALYRAVTSIEYGGDIGVGIEGGVLFNIGYPIEGQVAVVVDRDNRVGLGFSSLFPLPEWVYRDIGSGSTLGSVMARETGFKDIGRLFGAVGYVTRGCITRVELSYQATLMAITPFIKKGFYRRLVYVEDLKKVLKALKT